MVLTHKNKLINAVFHSSSAGMTENSQDVWEREFSYLTSVKDFDKNNPKLKWRKDSQMNNCKNYFQELEV